jgi:(S)-citramalyl-CoA lyase
MMQLRRSLRFVPGNRPDRFAKALAAGADSICIDLEDSVPPAEKAEALGAALDWIAGAPADGTEIVLRLNALDSGEGREDLQALVGAPAKPEAVMLPKVNAASELAPLAGLELPLIPIGETAEGLRNAFEIAASPGVAAILFGAVDLAVELRCELAWEPLLGARHRLVMAAGRARVDLYDVPAVDVTDLGALASSTARARALGFTGRACIHPSQIGPVNAAFTPSQAEADAARRIVDAFETAGGGVALLDGKLIEKPVALAARRMLAATQAARKG